MTAIRELLQEATSDLHVATDDASIRIGRHLTRRRRFRAAVAAIAVLVATAITVPTFLATTSKGSAPPANHPPTRTGPVVQTWESNVGDVAAGFGGIWALKCCGGTLGQTWVDELDPATGNRLTRIALPGPATSVAAGAGRVWTIGATDGGQSAISMIDPATRHVDTMALTDPLAEPDDIAFANGSAWVTFRLLDQVWRLTATSSGMEKSVLAVPRTPTHIATTGDGQLWVAQEAGGGSVTRILATPKSARLGTSKPWAGAIYTAHTGNSLMWGTTADLHSVVPLLPSRIGGNACINCNLPLAAVTGQIEAVAATSRGVFVSARGAPNSTGHTTFFGFHALSRTRRPPARITDSGELAPDGAGVVIATGPGPLIHWVPAD
jgi:hypothetical protein